MNQNGKPKIAFFDFTCCEGCQLTIIDSLQTHPELLEAVAIVQFREAMSEKGENYQIAFIEGSCTRKSDETRLQKIRSQAEIIVALGACAHLGGINALKSLHPLDEIRDYVYGAQSSWYDTYPARPIDAVIEVDYVIPGCPIDREEFIDCVKALLLGKSLPIPDHPVCVECKLKENSCLFNHGRVCLGPVARAGCKAICPSYGQSCEACRGFISNPNQASMNDVLAEHGMQNEDIFALKTMFNAYQMHQEQPIVGRTHLE